MSQKYTVNILGTEISLRSDKGEAYINALVQKITNDINNILIHNGRTSRTDAVVMCALSYLDKIMSKDDEE